jgi:hypothetical protein
MLRKIIELCAGIILLLLVTNHMQTVLNAGSWLLDELGHIADEISTSLNSFFASHHASTSTPTN